MKRWLMTIGLLLVMCMIVPVIPAVANSNVVIVTLQRESGKQNIYYGNIQSAFPNAGWNDASKQIIVQIPAGQYPYIGILGLPDRRGKSPVIITNAGGQVKVGQPGVPRESRDNYAFKIQGGANWILTGEYNPTLGTGHTSFRGHQNGTYASSRGKYGIEISHTKNNGLEIGEHATDFELSYIETHNTHFAGYLIKTDGQPNSTMNNVKIHDLYIHDTGAEGLYIGNTSDNAGAQHKFTNLKIYNNRIVRTGAEGLQISHLGGGSRIHNNVILMSAQEWKNPFQLTQDFGVQLGVRNGNIEFDRNIIIGAASNLFNVRFLATGAERTNGSGQLNMHTNYLSHSRGFLAYHFQSDKGGPDFRNEFSTFRFANNKVSGLNFHLNEVRTENNPNRFVSINQDSKNQLTYQNNQFEGAQQFIQGISDTNGNGTNTYINASGNQRTTIQPVRFMDNTFPPDFDYLKMEKWFPALENRDANVWSSYNKVIQYQSGDYVVHNSKMYRALANHNGANHTPGSSPSVWQEVTMMTDDLRLHPDSPHQGIGLLDTVSPPQQQTLQLIVPAGADTSSGSAYFPMGHAFEGTVSYNASTGQLSGGSGGNFAPYYPSRHGYIDFGASWAKVRIVETWTKYRVSSVGNSTPYAALWWDDDKDNVNDSGLNEASINFNTKQGLDTGNTEPWFRDRSFSANPITPKARYLILQSPSTMTQRALEYAIIGYITN